MNKKVNNNKRMYKPINKNKKSMRKEPVVKDLNTDIIDQDPRWYGTSEMVANMASLPWNTVVGSKAYSSSHSLVPGALTINIQHGIPYQNGFDFNTLTRSANTFFQYFTQGFTSSVDFEAPDLMMTAIAGASLAALLEEGRRAYGTMRYYLNLNAYYAKAIVQSLGFDFESLKTNLANFRAEFNIRVAQFANLIALPKDFPILKKWTMYAANLFTDTTSPDYSTIMAYSVCGGGWSADEPGGVLVYSGTASKFGTCLLRRPIGGPVEVAEYFEVVDELITALSGDDPRNMFGALRRVYSASEFYVPAPLEDNYLTPVTHVDIMDAIIHNMDWYEQAISSYGLTYPEEAAGENVWVWQSENGHILSIIGGKHYNDLTSEFYILNGTNTNARNKIIDMYDHEVTPDNVVDVTSGMCGEFYDGDNQGSIIFPRDFISRNVTVTVLTGTGEVLAYPIPKYIPHSIQSVGAVMEAIAQITKIDSHPLIYTVSTVTDNPTHISAIHHVIGELDRYTFVSHEYLRELHDRCAYTLFGLPQSTRSTTN